MSNLFKKTMSIVLAFLVVLSCVPIGTTFAEVEKIHHSHNGGGFLYKHDFLRIDTTKLMIEGPGLKGKVDATTSLKLKEGEKYTVHVSLFLADGSQEGLFYFENFKVNGTPFEGKLNYRNMSSVDGVVRFTADAQGRFHLKAEATRKVLDHIHYSELDIVYDLMKQSDEYPLEGKAQTIAYGGEIPKAESFVKSSSNLEEVVESYTIAEALDNKKEGNQDVTVTVTFKDGSSSEVKTTLTVQSKPAGWKNSFSVQYYFAKEQVENDLEYSPDSNAFWPDEGQGYGGYVYTENASPLSGEAGPNDHYPIGDDLGFSLGESVVAEDEILDRQGICNQLKEKLQAMNEEITIGNTTFIPSQHNFDLELFRIIHIPSKSRYNVDVKVTNIEKKKFKVTFKDEFDEFTEDKVTEVPYGDKAQIPSGYAEGSVYKKGLDNSQAFYKFLGWYKNNGEKFDFDTPITEALELSAKWEKQANLFPVKFYFAKGKVADNAYFTYSAAPSDFYPGSGEGYDGFVYTTEEKPVGDLGNGEFSDHHYKIPKNLNYSFGAEAVESESGFLTKDELCAALKTSLQKIESEVTLGGKKFVPKNTDFELELFRIVKFSDRYHIDVKVDVKEGGNDQGGNDQGGNDQGGNDQGGNDQGGNDQGGNDQGGNDQGGNDQGGNDQGNDDNTTIDLEEESTPLGTPDKSDDKDQNADQDKDQSADADKEETEIINLEEEETPLGTGDGDSDENAETTTEVIDLEEEQVALGGAQLPYTAQHPYLYFTALGGVLVSLGLLLRRAVRK